MSQISNVLTNRSTYFKWRREVMRQLDKEGLLSLVIPKSDTNIEREAELDFDENKKPHSGPYSPQISESATPKSNQGLFECKVHALEAQRNRMERAKAVLINSVSTQIAGSIIDLTPMDTWIYLQHTYRMPKFQAVPFLFDQLLDTKLKYVYSLEKYMANHSALRSDLAMVGAKLDDAYAIHLLLKNLTLDFDKLLDFLSDEQSRGVELTLEDVEKRIRAWETHLRLRDDISNSDEDSEDEECDLDAEVEALKSG